MSYLGEIMKKYIFVPYIVLSIMLFSNFCARNILSSSAHDFAPNVSGATMEKLSVIEKKDNEIADKFSTGNVVKSTFSARVFPVFDMHYHDYNGVDHKNDAYAIMEYTKDGGDFYYAHSAGAFNSLKYLRNDDVFVVNGMKFRVERVDVYLLDSITTPIMNGIRRSTDTNGVKYAASFMTCSDGNTNTGDYRFVVFASRV